MKNGWQIKDKAYYENSWFLPQFINMAINNIASQYLDPDVLENAVKDYHIPEHFTGSAYTAKTIGIVMAGNIPLVGFHDFCCAFLTGHKQVIKLSSSDSVLLKHLMDKMTGWNPEVSLVSYAGRS